MRHHENRRRDPSNQTEGWIQVIRSNAKDWRAVETWLRFTALLEVVHWCVMVEARRMAAWDEGWRDRGRCERGG